MIGLTARTRCQALGRLYFLTAGLAFLLAHGFAMAQEGQESSAAKAYFRLEKPIRILSRHQRWEGDQFPHTLSVVEMNRDGFRYWGWYGLNEGRGIGLARSKDLMHWVKYGKNPLLTNARWPSVLAKADPNDPELLYVAYTRDYDTPASYIVLAATHDGVHMAVRKILVQPVTHQRNQNPNLFRDPRTGRFYLTWYRGSGHSEIVSRNADRVEDLDRAPDKILLSSDETLAAPTLLFLPGAAGPGWQLSPVYYLSAEIHPRGTEWQTKVFVASAADGDFRAIAENPVLNGGRACLFQHIFQNRFYGYLCHEVSPDQWTLEVVQAPLGLE
ncbi:MAG TPA: hypothetical protein VHM88_16565 [Candidatus Acidoferrales bacterium]|nr:hypothetical protein [Candidatus Acidoferrales bacterium]